MIYARDFPHFRLLLATGLVLAGAVRGAEPFAAFLDKHCIRCRGPKKERKRPKAEERAQVTDWIAALWMGHWSDADGRLCRGQLVEVTNPQALSTLGVTPPTFFQDGSIWGRVVYLPSK